MGDAKVPGAPIAAAGDGAEVAAGVAAAEPKREAGVGPSGVPSQAGVPGPRVIGVAGEALGGAEKGKGERDAQKAGAGGVTPAKGDRVQEAPREVARRTVVLAGYVVVADGVAVVGALP